MDYEKFLDRQFVMTDTKRIDRVRDLYTTFNPHVDLEALKTGGYLDALAEQDALTDILREMEEGDSDDGG